MSKPLQPVESEGQSQGEDQMRRRRAVRSWCGNPAAQNTRARVSRRPPTLDPEGDDLKARWTRAITKRNERTQSPAMGTRMAPSKQSSAASACGQHLHSRRPSIQRLISSNAGDQSAHRRSSSSIEHQVALGTPWGY